MYQTVAVKEDVYWLGGNDRKTRLFENLWPLEKGVSYNSYMVVDEKVALIDTVDKQKSTEFLAKIKNILNGRKIDYLIINHMEPDHSGSIADIAREYPDIQIIGNKMTFVLLHGFFGKQKNELMIEDGAEINLGSRSLKIYVTPWVHWPETMMTYDAKHKILFSGDAFGSFGTLDGGVFDDELDLDWYWDEMRRYYSNIVGKYSKMVQKAMEKLAPLQIDILASTHGPIWRTQVAKVLELNDKWSKNIGEPGVVIVFGSMYGNTEYMAEIIARRLSERGVKQIRIYDSAKTHVSYILSDIWKYNGVMLGSSAYNAGVFPAMDVLTNTLLHVELKDRYLGTFGSSGWNKAGVKGLNKFAEESGWEIVYKSAETRASVEQDSYNACLAIADAMADKILAS